MNGLQNIYGEYSARDAAGAVKRALLLYCAVVLAFVAATAAFVVLYLYVNALLWLCAMINFAVTVVFFWFTVLFFYAVFPQKRAMDRFFKNSEYALVSRTDGVFSGVGQTVTITKLKFTELFFDVNGKKETLYILADTACPFQAGRAYALQKIGDRITAFGEADNG